MQDGRGGSLQWADSSEGIHSSLTDNTEVSYAEELWTAKHLCLGWFPDISLARWDINPGKSSKRPGPQRGFRLTGGLKKKKKKEKKLFFGS